MYVKKRNGKLEEVKFDKITKRLQILVKENGLSKKLDLQQVTKEVISNMIDNMTTPQLDALASETCVFYTTQDPDYMLLAGAIEISNLHKNTGIQIRDGVVTLKPNADFASLTERLYTTINPFKNKPQVQVSPEYVATVRRNAAYYNSIIDYKRDYQYSYFGYKTLEKSYLLKLSGKIVERPQDVLMRVAIQLWGDNLEAVKKTYDLLSEKFFTHASPTLFNSGLIKNQLSSCFLLTTKDDSIEGIYETLKKTALISQSAGGIGLSIHDIRAKGTHISGTGGTSNGIVPMLKVFNDTARYVDQGGGKRKGAFAIYLEPWHADIFSFLEMKLPSGAEELRARDLFFALWIPDLFMKRVEEDGNWTLMCPNECPGLSEVHGKEFEELYTRYEKEGRGKRTIRAHDLWMATLESQITTGSPYMLYKDSANMKSNQSNLGTIKSSNLCTEIIQYTSTDEIAVCNLASAALNKFIHVENGVKKYNFKALYDVVYQMTLNLNKIIDINYYPVPEAENSNMRHRPIGLGVQGLAETFFELRLPFVSDEAKKLNKDIFETIYFAAMTASNDVAIEKGGAYSTFEGSPLSEGKFQFNLWGLQDSDLSGMWDWETLRTSVMKHGVSNSLLVAPMPTASTSQILGNNECFEPITSNIYVRRVRSGDFPMVATHLVRELQALNLWSEKTKDDIVRDYGSIQKLSYIPQDIKDIYKTVYEIPQRELMNMSADRGAFICQSQSFNLWMREPNYGKLTSAHFHAWKIGLKTGMYYLRTDVDGAKSFTLDNTKPNAEKAKEQIVCSIESPEDCIACGS